jgi:integrase/recombinase XerD
MRVGEIGALNIEDVWDFQTNSVRDRIFLSGKRVKWGHAREVFLNRAVRRKLVEYISLREAAPVPLILSRSGRRFGRTALVGLFRELYRKAGIETSSHAGRALFITSLADNGVSIRIIQKAVGHRSLQATNHYMSARPSEIGKAVEFLK